MPLEHEDDPALSAGSRLPDIAESVPDADPAPAPVPEPLSAEQGAVIARTLAEVLETVLQLPKMFATQREHFEGELAQQRLHFTRELKAVELMMLGAVDGTAAEMRDNMNRHFAALDRKLDQQTATLKGELSALATEVSGLKHVTAETTRLAYKFAKEHAGDDDDERFAAAEVGQ
jgi:hypothetical protein